MLYRLRWYSVSSVLIYIQVVPIDTNFFPLFIAAPPVVIFNPPSVDGRYEVELGREFSLSCIFNRNIYPTPQQFEVSRASGMR